MNGLSKEEKQEILSKKIIEINGTINAMDLKLNGISNKLLRFDGALDQFKEDSRLIFRLLARISSLFPRGDLK